MKIGVRVEIYICEIIEIFRDTFDKTMKFLIGENNIGKTNILEFLNIFLCIGKFAESDFKDVLRPIYVKF